MVRSFALPLYLHPKLLDLRSYLFFSAHFSFVSYSFEIIFEDLYHIPLALLACQVYIVLYIVSTYDYRAWIIAVSWKGIILLPFRLPNKVSRVSSVQSFAIFSPIPSQVVPNYVAVALYFVSLSIFVHPRSSLSIRVYIDRGHDHWESKPPFRSLHIII